MSSNLWVWWGIGVMMLAQAALIYLPAMNWLFHTVPIGLDEWLLAIGSGLVIYLIVGMEKMIRRWLHSRTA
jgi:magnesium-transporting ATPase (P-type)